MNHPIITAILLAGAIVVMGGCCVGILLMRGPMARLHYIGPAAMLAPVLVAVAVLAEKGFSQAG
ncbi:MAG TPA: hypothetical protein VFM25_02445, partial [Verrucomicrobiae bacterium]|nr:hypothetical protein [Verrucomicrobiae bacterium]